ncbi:putative ribonuclease H-like domain-containing protein, partial [Tanacetum coccineum]
MKIMAKKYVLQSMGKNTGQREIRPVWNNTQRINHQNKFVLTAVLTRSGRILPSILNTRVSKEKVNTVRVNGVNTAGQTAVSTVKGNGVTAVKASAGCVWRPKMTDLNNGSKDNSGSWISKRGNPQQALKYKGMFDSGCSRHMTGNKALLTDYQDIDGGFVAFGGSTRGGKITGIGKIRTNKIDFEDVFFVKELKFNLFSVSQMCDKKNSVLFTETECLVLSPDFKLIDESQVLLRVPRQNNMYNFDLKNVVPSGDLTCLFAKATIDESKLWHRRLGHVNFKTMNKLVKGNLVRGLPSKTFENDHTCVACQKGKQHKASCKTKHVSSISQPLQMLHMDLFGPTSVRSINHKTYFLVVTDDFSREMDEFCGQKGIKREYSVARTPQQNEVAERKNKTLIEAARTMLADSLLPTVFWAEAVNTACYAFRVFNSETRKDEENMHVNSLENKPNVTRQGPNWLFDIDSLTNSMNYQPVTAGNQTNKNAGPQETNGNTGLKKNVDAGQTEGENVSTQQYIMFPLWSFISSNYKSSDDKAKDDTVNDDACKKTVQEPASENDQTLQNVLDKMMDQEKEATEQSNAVRKEFEAPFNTASASRTFSPVGPSSGPSFVPFGGSFPIDVANLPHDPLMLELEDTVEIRIHGFLHNETGIKFYYGMSQKELLAVIQDISKWRGYLLDRHFKIKTDHFSLKYLLEPRITTPSQMKWLPKLMGFDYEILYKQGSENKKFIKDLELNPHSQKHYSWVNGQLRRKGKLVVGNNEELRQQLLQYFHADPSGGHSGSIRPGYQTNKPDLSAYPGLLQHLPIPTLVWSDISMDFIEGLPSSNGESTIFVVVDRLNNVYKLHGLPTVIVGDRDKVFVSLFWKEFFKALKVSLHLSTAYHPQTDGQTEVVNGCLKCYLRCMSWEKPKAWAKWCLVDAVDRTLAAREAMIQLLQFYLERAQQRMKGIANAKRTDREYRMDDWVYLKLQPHRQVSLRTSKYSKLNPKYYGPFQVIQKVGQVAYKLALPSSSLI